MNSKPSRQCFDQFRGGGVEAPLAGRRATIAALACWIVAPMSQSVLAQQKPAKVYRIGTLTAGPRVQRRFHKALRDNLRELNYVEGKNLVIEERFAEGNYELMPKLASELVALRLDVIVTQGTPATLAAKNATTTIPIVMTGAGDAAAMGIVASLARPGGNITGMTIYEPELFAKRLELMKQALPHIRRVAVWLNPVNPAQERSFHAGEKVAKVLQLELRRFEPRSLQEFESVFTSMAQQRVDALILSNDTVFNTNARTIAKLAIKHRLPLIGPIE